MTAPSSGLTPEPEPAGSVSTLESNARPRRDRRWVRRLTRVVLALVVIGAIAFGAYLLWPEIDERLTTPIAANTDDIAVLNDRLDGFEARIAELESRTEAVLAAGADERIGEDEVTDRLTELEATIEAQGSRLEGLEETAFGLAESDQIAAAETMQEVTVLRAMELMSRARLSLYQANYGSARDDVVAARSVLEELESNDRTITEAIERLEVTIDALPDRPVPAVSDLDIAWRILLGDIGVPVSSAPADSVSTTTIPDTTSATTSP